MKILETAKLYENEYEIEGNRGFKNLRFQEKMVADGFIPGDAWCALFQEMIWEEAYPEHEGTLDKLFHKSCDQTYKNFKAAGYEMSDIPVEGSLGIMKHFTDGKEDWKGHAFLVTKQLTNSTWHSFEGNTNEAGSREGIKTGYQTRSLMYHPTGLRMKSFILIRETLKIVD